MSEGSEDLPGVNGDAEFRLCQRGEAIDEKRHTSRSDRSEGLLYAQRVIGLEEGESWLSEAMAGREMSYSEQEGVYICMCRYASEVDTS